MERAEPAPRPADLYRRLAVEGARRLLARLDRRSWSLTHGCFDREYWAYQTLLEAPRADFQQAVWGLALLWRRPFPGNPFHRRPEVLAAVAAGIAFWTRMRHRDGSVDEWYENEHSFCATAFTTAAAAEALRLAGEELADDERRRGVEAVAASARWLIERLAADPPPPANQHAAAGLAVAAAAAVAGDSGLARELPGLVAALAARQDPDEGWLDEYGGPDFGYSLLTLDLLACLAGHAERGSDGETAAAVAAVAGRLLGFLDRFAAPDGTVGAACGSRGTRHGFVWGAAAFAARGNAETRRPAARLAAGLGRALAAGRLPTLATADDTYATYFYFASTCLAASLEPAAEGAAAATATGGEAAAGHQVLERGALVGWRAGGAQVVIDARRGSWELRTATGAPAGDHGWVAVAATDGEASERFAGASRWRTEELPGGGLRVELSKPFGRLDGAVPLARWGPWPKLFARYGLRPPAVARRLGRALKRRRVARERRGRLTLHRTWTLTADGVVVEDEITNPPGPAAVLVPATLWSGRHSPSALLDAAPAGPGAGERLEIAGGTSHRRRLEVPLP